MSWRRGGGGGSGGGGRSFLCSTNEFLAQKKNMAEEARLMDHLHLIQRRRILSTSGMDMELKRVHSDLCHVRSSTGHSVEALLRTPFRLHKLRGGGHRSSSIQVLSLHSPSPKPTTSYHHLHAIRSLAQRQDTAGGREGGDQGTEPFGHPVSHQQPLYSEFSPQPTWRSSVSPHVSSKSPCPSPRVKQKARGTSSRVEYSEEILSPSMKDKAEGSASLRVKESPAKGMSPGGQSHPEWSGLSPRSKEKAKWSVYSHVKREEGSVSPYVLQKTEENTSPIVLQQSEEILSPRVSRDLEGSVSPHVSSETQNLKVTSHVLGSEPTVRGQGRRYSVDFKQPELFYNKWYPHFSEGSDLLPEDEVSLLSLFNMEKVPSTPSNTSQKQNQISTSEAGINQSQETEEERSGRRRSSATDCITPVAREISEMLDSVRQKNEELLAVKAVVVTFNAKVRQQEEQQRQEDQLKLLKARARRAVLKLPNTRYKCRTCLERVRDNARYRHSLQGKNKWSGKPESLGHVPAKDLHGNILDGCGSLNTDQEGQADTTEKTKPDENHSEDGEVKPRRVGYSRTRMEQLAEPKGGLKLPLNISGWVLRRQAEALRCPHRDTRLSEREQERMLRLQSRVRLFLAELQERQIPSTMVHIPQRDDIMQVDISHVG